MIELDSELRQEAAAGLLCELAMVNEQERGKQSSACSSRAHTMTSFQKIMLIESLDIFLLEEKHIEVCG